MRAWQSPDVISVLQFCNVSVLYHLGRSILPRSNEGRIDASIRYLSVSIVYCNELKLGHYFIWIDDCFPRCRGIHWTRVPVRINFLLQNSKSTRARPVLFP
jgi:hypothetical protein